MRTIAPGRARRPRPLARHFIFLAEVAFLLAVAAVLMKRRDA